MFYEQACIFSVGSRVTFRQHSGGHIDSLVFLGDHQGVIEGHVILDYLSDEEAERSGVYMVKIRADKDIVFAPGYDPREYYICSAQMIELLKESK